MKKKKGNIAYYLFFFILLFSCDQEKIKPSKSTGIILTCPDAATKATHQIRLVGAFTRDAETIVPPGKKSFPIKLNKEDLERLNAESDSVLCRVLRRHGIETGSADSLPKIEIRRGPGLKLGRQGLEFLIPPAEKAPELLSNFEHSLDRLLESESRK